MAELFDIITLNTNKASNVVVTANAAPGQEVIALSVPSLPAGKYIFSYSFQATFGDKNASMFFAVTGSQADTTPFADAADDNQSLHKNKAYSYPMDWPGGAWASGLNIYRSIGLSALTIDFVDMSLVRVG